MKGNFATLMKIKVRSIIVFVLISAASVMTMPALPQDGQSSRLTYAYSWESDLKQPEFAQFRSWTSRYLEAADAKAKQSLIAEGRQLARQRRAAFTKLIKSDPAQALALTVPAAMRKKLPVEILLELETRVSGIGDYLPMAVDRAPGGRPVESVQRFVCLNNQTYRAYVYGRRTWQTTKYGIPLHGVAIDGVIALAETSLREVEPDEAGDISEAIVDLNGRGPAIEASAVLGEIGGTVYRFVSHDDLLETETKLEAAEAGIGPKPKQSARKVLELGLNLPQQETQAAPTPWTTGNKQFLVIRVDFSDLPGNPVGPWWNPTTYTAPVAQNYLDNKNSPFFAANSYGLTSLTNTVTPQLYRLPRTAQDYATAPVPNGFLDLINDAKTAASADYNVSGYDRIAVLSSALNEIPGSHLGASGGGIGGSVIHISGDLPAVTHELGHTYGLYHADLWQVNDGNPVSTTGSEVDYGDKFDVMGGAVLPDYSIDLRAHFNPWFKNTLAWLTDNRVQAVTADGVYRIYCFDTATPAAGLLALKIPRDVTRDYWVSCRRNFTDNPSMQNGAYIIWGYHANRPSDLLDMTTPGNNATDVALAIGSTFTDHDEGVSIEVLDQGGSGSAQYIDVRVILLSRTVARAPLDNDPGWTRQGEWAFGKPTGQGGGSYGHPDPTSGATGTNVFGVNLNGNFSTAVGGPYYLVAGPFNFTGYTRSKLSFARWLNSDYPPRFRSTVEVSSNGATWASVWEATGEVTDSSWTKQLYDISATADNQSTVFVRWGYNMTEPGNPYSGWNIDDVELNAVPATTPSPTPTPTPTPTATPPPGLVGNVSTRLPVGTGDNVLIEGFTVQGPAGSTKKIIVRAIGPSLTPFGVTDALPNPTLEIHDSGNNNIVAATNDDWKVTQLGNLITADQSAEIAASGFKPGNDLESAIIANLPPGSYTAVVRAAGGTNTGTGVVDAYDLSAASSAKLVNVATRGLIQPGDKLMIAGFITQNGPVRAVVRAIGPSLAAFGITNALPDTTLQLRDQNGAIVVENDDWKVRTNGTSQQAEMEATQLQPTNDLEAAFVTTLQPGQYTAQVRGKPESTGIGVVQVYFLQ
jgi:hypothetical protein